MMKKDEQILRKFVKNVLAEDDGGGDIGFDIGMGAGGGYQGFADASHLKRIVQAVWTDPKSALMGMGEDVFANAKAVISVFFESIMSTIVPFLDSEYEKIFKRRDERLSQTEKKYGDAWKRTVDSFKDSDLTVLSFMANPGLFMTGLGFWKVPGKAASSLKFLTGGVGSEIVNSVVSAANEIANFATGEKSSIAKPYKKKPYKQFEESRNRLNEESDGKNKKQDYINAVKEFKRSGGLEEVLNSKRAQEVANFAKGLTKQYLSEIIAAAHKAQSSVKSLADVEKMLDQNAQKQLAGLNDQERKAMEQQLVQATQKSVSAYFVAKLTDELKAAKQAGMPDGTEIEKMYRRAIAAIS